MKTTWVLPAVCICILLLAGVGFVYYQSQQAAAKREADRHLSDGFKAAAEHAVRLIDTGNFTAGDLASAMTSALRAEATEADHKAGSVLNEFRSRWTLYDVSNKTESDRKAYEDCSKAIHAVLKSGEVGKEAEPCLAWRDKDLLDTKSQDH